MGLRPIEAFPYHILSVREILQFIQHAGNKAALAFS
jgi:hypothetical protein